VWHTGAARVATPIQKGITPVRASDRRPCTGPCLAVTMHAVACACAEVPALALHTPVLAVACAAVLALALLAPVLALRSLLWLRSRLWGALVLVPARQTAKPPVLASVYWPLHNLHVKIPASSLSAAGCSSSSMSAAVATASFATSPPPAPRPRPRCQKRPGGNYRRSGSAAVLCRVSPRPPRELRWLLRAAVPS
jgi:hypothetical protein